MYTTRTANKIFTSIWTEKMCVYYIFKEYFNPATGISKAHYNKLVGFDRATRLFAARTRFFKLINTQEEGAAERPSAHRSFAAPLGEINDIERKSAKNPIWGKIRSYEMICFVVSSFYVYMNWLLDDNITTLYRIKRWQNVTSDLQFIKLFQFVFN